jgi:UPF0755 protein
MNNDIKPRVPDDEPKSERVVEQITSANVELPKLTGDFENRNSNDGSRLKKRMIFILAFVVVFAFILMLIGWIWYKTQLQAVMPSSDEKVKVTVAPGTDTSGIANLLKQNDLIRNETAFLWYVRLNGTSNLLQSGTYRLAKSDDVPVIVDHLTSGKTDTFSITFLPGDTLSKHRQKLIDAGYDTQVVDAALNKDYSELPLFSGKPASADLEGYIYGETYNFPAESTPEQILLRTFEQYQTVIDENEIVDGLKKRGFSLYEGITLASIIQREVITEADMAQVSQVFQLRLDRGMELGSDVTYQYAADKMGVPRDVNLDSPYNTRRYPGLPPGPIASPSTDALLSVANPAPGNYVYFLSGDDDKTYFARTNEEHERNIRDHCQKKCQII